MQIDSAVYTGGCLVLRTSDPLARRFAYEFQQGEYQIEKAKRKRSLDANAYCFVLIDKLAAAVGLTKEEVYRRAIKEIGGNSDVVCVKNEAVDSLCKAWSSRGLGWQTETFPSKINGCTNVILYYGSSCYSVQQMNALIQNVVHDCEQLGIETMPPERLAVMMNEWR